MKPALGHSCKGMTVSKKTIAKVAGFVGTLGAGAALVATAATGTGAWFTDAKDGSLSATSGNLTLNTDNTTINFTGLMPGEDRSQTIGYNVNASSGKVDVWLKFDTTTQAYSLFSGGKGQNGYADGGLGRYGHFKVSSAEGTFFDSYNLANDPNGYKSGCADNAKGWGSVRPANGPNDYEQGYCGVPGYILVASNLVSGATGNFTITFGLTGKQKDQNQVQVSSLPYQVVATQAGKRPDAANF